MNIERLEAMIKGKYRIEKDADGWRVLHYDSGELADCPPQHTYLGALGAAALAAGIKDRWEGGERD